MEMVKENRIVSERGLAMYLEAESRIDRGNIQYYSIITENEEEPYCTQCGRHLTDKNIWNKKTNARCPFCRGKVKYDNEIVCLLTEMEFFETNNQQDNYIKYCKFNNNDGGELYGKVTFDKIKYITHFYKDESENKNHKITLVVVRLNQNVPFREFMPKPF